MAITILREPDNLQPTMSDGLFYTISSDKTNNLKYRYVFWVYVNNVKVFQGKSTPNPEGLGVIDISEILNTYCNSSVEITDASANQYIHETEKFSLFKDNQVVEYYAVFGEEYSTGLTSSVVSYRGIDDNPGDPSLQSLINKAFDGTLINNVFSNRQDFDNTPYVLNQVPERFQKGLFLTNSPRILDVSMNDRHTLSFFNYNLSGGLISYPYKANYTFYDGDGNVLDSYDVDNIISNGAGPLNAIVDGGYDDDFIIQSAYTYNVVNVASGPYNINEGLNIPAGTKHYEIKLLGKDQSSSVGCPAGYTAGYIQSCGFDYQIPVCYPDGLKSTRFYWPLGLSQWNADCFFLASSGGPGGEIFSGGTDYGNSCALCYEVEFGGIPATAPNDPPTPSSAPITSLTAVSETFQFNIVDDCDYFNNKQLVWKNRYGAFDYYKFNKRKSEGLNIQRQTYKQLPVNWGSSDPKKTSISRGLTDFNVSIDETHIINTGFVNQATMVWLEGVYTSPEVYLIENDGSLFPINITSTDYIRKNRGNKELINLELTYVYSNNIKLN